MTRHLLLSLSALSFLAIPFTLHAQPATMLSVGLGSPRGTSAYPYESSAASYRPALLMHLQGGVFIKKQEEFNLMFGLEHTNKSDGNTLADYTAKSNLYLTGIAYRHHLSPDPRHLGLEFHLTYGYESTSWHVPGEYNFSGTKTSSGSSGSDHCQLLRTSILLFGELKSSKPLRGFSLEIGKDNVIKSKRKISYATDSEQSNLQDYHPLGSYFVSAKFFIGWRFNS